MKKIILGILLGIVVLLLMLVAMAPASTILPMLKSALPQQVKALQFGQVDGSIWSPSINNVSYQNFSLKKVDIELNPLSLFIGKLKGDISIQDPKLHWQSQLSVDQKQVAVKAASYQLQASQFDPLMKFPVKGLAGELSGSLKQFILTPQNKTIQALDGEGTWQNAVIYYLEQRLALGDLNYQLTTNEQGDAIVQIMENRGLLDLKGNLRLSQSKEYFLELSTQQTLPAELEQWIKRLAQLQNNRYHIKWNGRL